MNVFKDSKPLLYKVRPVKDKIPPRDDPTAWLLPSTHRFYDKKNPNRKVLLCKHVFERRNGKDTTPPDDSERFYVDVPDHFFAKPTTKGGDRGDFIAEEYSDEETLVVRWTGYGKYSGWQETNYSQRGAGGESSSSDSTPACARWS